MFRRLEVYTYHLKPGAAARADGLEDAVAVKEGFSWPAYLFTALWAVCHRLWLTAAAIAAGMAAVGYMAATARLDPVLALAILIAIQVLLGFHGNDLRRAKLARRGFVLTGIAAATDPSEADRRFFDSVLTDPEATPPSASAGAVSLSGGPWG